MAGKHRPSTTSATMLFSNPRFARIAIEQRRLRRAVADYVASRQGLATLGTDPLVEQLVSAAGFDPYDLAIVTVGARGGQFTVVGVPTRIWREPDDMLSLFGVKADFRSLRGRCVLVPQKWLNAPRRSASARAIAGSRNIALRHAEQVALLAHVGDSGTSTVEACAAVIRRHADPYGAVLALVARGHLLIDRHAKLGPGTTVRPVTATVREDGATT